MGETWIWTPKGVVDLPVHPHPLLFIQFGAFSRVLLEVWGLLVGQGLVGITS